MSNFKLVKLVDAPVVLNVQIPIKPTGNWNSTHNYSVGDLAVYDGLSYIAIQDNVNLIPKDNPSQWQVIVDIELGDNHWLITGNRGIDPNINYIGNEDAVDLPFRTNDTHRMTIDKDGKFGLGPEMQVPKAHFHQKSHTGFANSGLRQETYSLTTSSNTAAVAYAIPLAQNSILKVEFHAIARVSDGTGMACFKRTAMFFRQGGNVQENRTWQTDFTDKTDKNFNVSYTMGVSELTIYVKSSTNTDTYWTGHVQYEVLETNV